MDDLICRQAAIDAIESVPDSNWTSKRYSNEIRKLPSAQPEIIRCKDCEHWDTTWQNDWAKNYHYCPITDGTHRGDWYCADAERRTDGFDRQTGGDRCRKWNR